MYHTVWITSVNLTSLYNALLTALCNLCLWTKTPFVTVLQHRRTLVRNILAPYIMNCVLPALPFYGNVLFLRCFLAPSSVKITKRINCQTFLVTFIQRALILSSFSN